MDPKQHWNTVYGKTEPGQVSWFQFEPRISLDLIQTAAKSLSAAILDAGGGASTLVDHLVASGYTDITVADVSKVALQQAENRLGPNVPVRWLCADVLADDLGGPYDVWHDRAVFHFLTSHAERERYVSQVRRTVRPGGHVIVATFAPDGPEKCSGLDVCRYDPESLHGEFGSDFELLHSSREDHRTPWGVRQSFVYCLCSHGAPPAVAG